jgi:hypothetical protein
MHSELKSYYARAFSRRRKVGRAVNHAVVGSESEQSASSATGFHFVFDSLTLGSVARLNEIDLAVSTEITLQRNLGKVLARPWVWRYGFQSPCSISKKRGLHSFY